MSKGRERRSTEQASKIRTANKPAAIVDRIGKTSYRDGVRMLGKCFDLQLQPVGMSAIVGVHPRHQGRARFPHHAIRALDRPRSGPAANEPDPAITLRPIAKAVELAVGRAVVEDDEFEIAEAL